MTLEDFTLVTLGALWAASAFCGFMSFYHFRRAEQWRRKRVELEGRERDIQIAADWCARKVREAVAANDARWLRRVLK